MNDSSRQYSNQLINQREVVLSGNISNLTNSISKIFNNNTDISSNKFSSKIMKEIFNGNLQNINKFNFDDLESTKCSEHEEFKDNFLIQIISGHNLYDAVCSGCLSELQQINDNNVRSRLYSSVIKDNRDKIIQIKENKIDFNLVTKANSISATLQEYIMTIADELIAFTESFESEVLNKLSDKRTHVHDIEKIRVFISEILDEKNEPMLKNIGKDDLRKIKFLKLAYFLLNFKGIANNINSYTGITETLKLHLTKIIELRNIIVKRLTDWIRLIIGNFYEYLFELERIRIDNNFLNELMIDFIGESDIKKIRIEYEETIKNKDERIKSLEYEINQLKNQLQNSQNTSQNQSNDDFVTNMLAQIKQIEEKWMVQNNIITQLNQEIETLKRLNNDYLLIIENLKNDVIRVKSEIESRFQNLFIKMKEEYESKLIEVVENLDDKTKKNNQIEKVFNEQIRNLIREKEDILRIVEEKEEIIRNNVERINMIIKEKDEIIKIIKEKEKIIQNMTVTQITEKTVYIDKPIPEPERIVEKLIDKIIYVDKPIEKIVYVEKPVEKIVYIEKYVEVGQKFETIKEVERLMTNVIEIDNTDAIKKTYKIKYEKYFNDLKMKITKYQQEWDLLYSNYNTLLADFKLLLDANYRLKNVIAELELIIEKHNLEIGNLDVNIRKEIESLTKTSLSNKNIEWNSQKDIVFKSSSDLEALKTKISRIETKKFSNSTVLLEDFAINARCIFTDTQNSILEGNGIITNSFSPFIPDFASSVISEVRLDIGDDNKIFGTAPNLYDFQGTPTKIQFDNKFLTGEKYSIHDEGNIMIRDQNGDETRYQMNLTDYLNNMEKRNNSENQNQIGTINTFEAYGYKGSANKKC